VLTLINTRARITINNEYAEALKVEFGVKQEPLSTALFHVVVDVIVKQLDLRGNNLHLKLCSACSDDILIRTITQQSLIHTFQRLTNQSLHFRLILNYQKTECLRCSKTESGPNNIDIESKYVEQVKSYKYFGSMLIKFQLDATVCRHLFSATSLYMFRVSCTHHQEY